MSNLKTYKELMNEDFVGSDYSIEYFQSSKAVMKLLKKIKSQQQRIDAAKEYIKENEFYLDYKTGACIKGVVPLLEILGGE